jgi:iron complex outermembrane receptor protein
MHQILIPCLLLFGADREAAPQSAADQVADELLEEIIVRGAKQKPHEESLTMREVRESSAKDVAEALELVEGVSIVRRGAIASDLALRGMQRDNVTVVMDGQPIYGACPNRMDPPAFHFDFSEVESIRVVKGPYDVSQPGSIAGMVDLQAKRAGRDLTVAAHGGVDAFGGTNLSATLGYGGDNAAGLVGYAYKDSNVPLDGRGAALTEAIDETSPHRYADATSDQLAYVVNTAWTHVDLDLSAHARSRISYAYQDAKDVLYPFLLMDARYDTGHRIGWSLDVHDPGPGLDALHAQIFWNRVDHLMDNQRRQISVGKPDGYTMRSDADVAMLGGQLSGDATVFDGTLSAGVDTHRRTWDVQNRMFNMMAGAYGEQSMIPDVLSQGVGAFADYERPIGPALSVRGGMRLDLVGVRARGLTPDRLGTLYAPYFDADVSTGRQFAPLSGNLQVSWAPHPRAELFAGVARTGRVPDPQELYIGIARMSSNWVGNPLLRPVDSRQVDLGAKLFTDRFHVSASGFFADVRDFIYVTDRPDPDGAGALKNARSFTNLDARMAGAELGAEVALPLHLFLKSSLSWVWGEQTDNGDALAEMPPLHGDLGLRFDLDWVFVEVTERFAARQGRVDAGLSESETPAWAATDARAGIEYAGARLVVGAYNLLGEHYYSHLSYMRDPFATGTKVPELGRNLMVSLSYAL